jgi:hypothetical protein
MFCKRKATAWPYSQGVTHLNRYPDAMRFASNSYFFFFLAVFLDFFFFAFFAMFPSVIPKVGSMQVDNSTCMHSDYTTIVKLILRASKKVNGRRARRPSASEGRKFCRVSADQMIE